MIECRYCGEYIRDDPESLGARCPRCREPLHERGGGPRLADDPGASPGAAACAVHVGNLAVGTCQRCGNFVCRVCRMCWHQLPLCLSCVERAVQEKEGDPAEAHTHRRQALWSVIFGLLAWGILFGTAPLLAVTSPSGDNALAVFSGVLALISMVPSTFGVGLGAAAIRNRGDRMILASCGVVLSALHLGTLAGVLLVGISRR